MKVVIVVEENVEEGMTRVGRDGLDTNRSVRARIVSVRNPNGRLDVDANPNTALIVATATACTLLVLGPADLRVTHEATDRRCGG